MIGQVLYRNSRAEGHWSTSKRSTMEYMRNDVATPLLECCMQRQAAVREPWVGWEKRSNRPQGERSRMQT